MSLGVGTHLGSLEITALLGRGGMGEVYRARDTKLKRDVAIKILPEEFSRDPVRVSRFQREAEILASLNHPNVAQIYGLEESDNTRCIVMELVEGETLQERLKRGPIPIDEALLIARQIAEALEAAHERGVIHRDLKPANIKLSRDGKAKVLDFGLAKAFQEQQPETLSNSPTLVDASVPGVILGTPAYMSPEQTRGEALDARSDIFSLGVVLYEAATGKLPFNGPSVLSIMHEVAAVEPPSPSTIRRDLPREFDLIIECALAKDKEQRYCSASELMAALQALKGSCPERVSGLVIAAEITEPHGEPEAFVGRELEMSRLDQFLRRAIDGSGRVVFLTGEPGIGKTSLAGAFLHRARRAYPALMLCRGRCVEQYGTGEAYLPFLEALGTVLSGPGRERIAAVLRTYAPTWCLQFPAVFSNDARLQRETIGATQERMLREIGDALVALAAIAPVVLLLEDLHWADPSSVDLLRHLCHRIVGHQRVLLIGTFRPEDVELSNHQLKNYKREMQAHKLCEEIALGPLGEEHLASYFSSQK